MPKPNIHPKWYPEAKVVCNGEVVATVGSTKPELNVDVWSGNHPFFTGTQKLIDTEGRVERFMRKYGMFVEETPAAPTAPKAESTEAPAKPAIAQSEPAKAAPAKAGKGKKK